MGGAAPPTVTPVSDVDAYRPPVRTSPDTCTLRLIPFSWLPWAVVATIVEGVLVAYVLQSTTGSDIVGGLLGASH